MTTRRSFLGTSTTIFGAGLLGLGGLGLMRSCAPSADVIASQSIRDIFNVNDLEVGQNYLFRHDFGPINVRRLSPDDLAFLGTLPAGRDSNLNIAGRSIADQSATLANIAIPATPPLAALWQICPRLGCVPLPNTGDFHGFFCPCCASHFDRLGRIYKGAAPRNMAVAELHDLGGGLIGIPDKSPAKSDLTRS